MEKRSDVLAGLSARNFGVGATFVVRRLHRTESHWWALVHSLSGWFGDLLPPHKA